MFEELVEAKCQEEGLQCQITNWLPLYKLDKKDGIRQWSIWTDGGTIFTEFGLLNGAKQVSSKVVEPKNTGRKNATTIEEQAILEADSMHKKQQDKGYRVSIDAAKEYILLPMLAQNFEDKKKKVKYPVHVQPKLDGVRCTASWGRDGIELMSRKGKPYNVPHIKEQLEKILPVGRVFDGELYLHGATFQEVTRLVKKLRPETETITYNMYDSFEFDHEDTPWEEREEYLSDLCLDVLTARKDLPNIRVIETCVAESEEDVYRLQKEFVAAGYEGAIVRFLDGVYEVGHRSNALLKVKSFMDREYKIVDFTEGVGKNVGCVTWICETDEGKQFSVVPKGTYRDKQDWFQKANHYIGSMLTVKFFEYTEDNIPRFPVGLGIRMEEDLP